MPITGRLIGITIFSLRAITQSTEPFIDPILKGKSQCIKYGKYSITREHGKLTRKLRF